MTDDQSNSEAIEADVLQWLREVDVDLLERICGELKVVIPEDKKGNKSLVLRLILRNLHSADMEALDDGGYSFFLKLHTALSAILSRRAHDIKAEGLTNRVNKQG